MHINYNITSINIIIIIKNLKEPILIFAVLVFIYGLKLFLLFKHEFLSEF